MALSMLKRIELLQILRAYLLKNSDEFVQVKKLAMQKNSWFIPEFLDNVLLQIATQFLDKEKLCHFVKENKLDNIRQQKIVGIVMAGNIPMVGFHDWLCCFLCGYITKIKLSSKDNVLLPHLFSFLIDLEPKLCDEFFITDNTIKNCDAYLTMGSNNSSLYFEKYFEKIPAIIRKNKTSIAILNGDENIDELQKLADDMLLYFGLGCRSVSKLLLPKGYDFSKLFIALKKYDYFFEYKKYKNNYDYQLTLLLLNKMPYITNDFLLFVENTSPFSPLSCVYYEYYDDEKIAFQNISTNTQLQCVIGNNHLAFGASQMPSLIDYPDNKNVIDFLIKL